MNRKYSENQVREIRNSMIAETKSLGIQLGKTPTVRELSKQMGISTGLVCYYFQGGFRELVRLAGYEGRSYHRLIDSKSKLNIHGSNINETK